MADNATTNVTPISADSQLSDEQKRERLRKRIEAGEKRNEERSFADQAKACGIVFDLAEQRCLREQGSADHMLVAGLRVG